MTTDEAPDATDHGGDVPTDREHDAPTIPDAEHYVYVLRCGDDTLYTGYTTDVERRVVEHCEGDGAKYTRGRTPIELVHVEAFPEQSAAMAREHAIKALSREEKLALVGEGIPDQG